MLNIDQIKNEVLNRIIQEVAIILEEKSIEPVEIKGDTPLSNISLSSLDLAELVSNLEAEYEVDPFEERVAITSIITAGDLASAYSLCLTNVGGEEHDELAEELKAIKNNIN